MLRITNVYNKKVIFIISVLKYPMKMKRYSTNLEKFAQIQGV